MKKTITMKKKKTHNPTASFSRKVMSFVTALLFMVLVMSFQTSMADEPQRITVEPDDFPSQIGALNIAIEQNGGDVIYVLKNGKTYFLDRAMEFDHFLQIEAEEYPSDNPPIIRPGADLTGSAPRISTYRNNILMKGIFFYAIDDFGGKQMSQRTSVEGIHLHYQHCYFMGGTNYFWWLGATNNTVRLEDSQLANAGRHTSVANQRFIDTRGNDTDSLIVINSSIYNLNFHLTRTGGAIINYLYWDHVTVMNHSLSTFDLTIIKDLTIKNSLFHHTNLDGAWEAASLVGDAGPGYDGPRYHTLGGMINISSIDALFEENPAEAPFTDADRSFVIKNNNFGGLPSQEILDLWEEFNVYDRENRPVTGRGSYPWGTDRAWIWANPDVTPDNPAWALRDTIPLVRIQVAPMDSLLTAWAAEEKPWVTVENNIRETITVPDMPQMPVEFIRAVWYGTEVVPHYDFYDEIVADELTRYFHPGPGNPVETTGPTASWFRDLAYNMNSQSYTLADRGYPVGNLNFFPELKELWLQGEDAPVVSVDEIQISNNQILAYPNPVRDALYLSQEVDEIKIYSLLGQQVLSASNVQSVNVSGLPKGVYILSIVNKNQVSSQKIMVTR